MIKRVLTLGDSTMQFNNFIKFPQTGWPQALRRFLKPEIEILNFAVNGKSTKNYISLGLFAKALEQVEEGDLIIIGFGHNDVKVEDPTRFSEPFGEYQENLKYMISACQSKGGKVLLVSSITERYFDGDKLLESRHHEYAKSAIKLAEEIDIPYVDLYNLTKEVVFKAGPEESKRFYMNFKANMYESHPEGLEDNTHLRYDGAFMVANCFYKEMLRKKLYEDIFISK